MYIYDLGLFSIFDVFSFTTNNVHLFTGSFVKVHVQNLCEPSAGILYRNADKAHVAKLKKELKERPDSRFTMMVGCTSDTEDLTKLEVPGGGRVEVLGGNHTRIALQELAADPALGSRFQHWNVQLYRTLPETLALKVSYDHNR